MLAFAGNSILCRLALADGDLDAASFTAVRLFAGAVTLAGILWIKNGRGTTLVTAGSWRSAVVLIVYAVCFSYAYLSLSAASGALILFGCAQGTMIAAALLAGERPTGIEVSGWLLAAVGLVILLLPGATAPSLTGSALMAVAGAGWGLYSLFGRAERQPLASTAGNFMRVLAPTVLLLPIVASQGAGSREGILIAALAGSVTTGIGYVIWYAALPGLKSMQAALVQLSVPAIAALGGVVLLGEALTARLVVAGCLILGGIWLAAGRKYRRSAAI